MDDIPADEKLKILAEWAKAVKNLMKLDKRLEVEIKEVDHEIAIHLKVHSN